MAINSIGNVNSILSPNFLDNDKAKVESVSKSFGDFLNEAINKVNDAQISAEKAELDFAAGRTDNIHQVTIAGEKAEIALQFTLQVRNKILDAYNEIMRMQI